MHDNNAYLKHIMWILGEKHCLYWISSNQEKVDAV